MAMGVQDQAVLRMRRMFTMRPVRMSSPLTRIASARVQAPRAEMELRMGMHMSARARIAQWHAGVSAPQGAHRVVRLDPLTGRPETVDVDRPSMLPHVARVEAGIDGNPDDPLPLCVEEGTPEERTRAIYNYYKSIPMEIRRAWLDRA